ncbi:unnamed protein product [Cylicocyclus nassatus]|uniref:rRNA-processing protein UTP23 homolog n=1 Tax=Cylicocyclus nassatus TaxID=53992 RepID=A0AA36H3U4_CYLNA|nr:unnamed protein product [Cylicocyclus nassatus]
MKVKRVKRANRILTFFKYSYKIVPPFRVLVDGTFCNAALANKINLREQLPKYLNGDVEVVTTKCVLAELENLGSPVYGALLICRQFTVDMCPHTPHRSPTECLAHLARRATTGHTKYIIATNDDLLSEKLRSIAGTPILYIKYNAILLDRVSEKSKTTAETSKSEIERVKEMKAAVLGDVEKKKKKRKIKGANPLSCKKKKVDHSSEQLPRTASGKRKRSKRKAALMNVTSICPRSQLVGSVLAPCSSILLLPATEDYPTQVVAGGTNGEVYFMCDGGTDVVRMHPRTNSPVTALASGNLRGKTRPELIAISADGFLQCVIPPYTLSTNNYSQTIQSNIAAAYVMDVDGDGQEELVVVMTDRVVRSFRWNSEDSRLHPINKWEVPSQVSAFSIGESVSSLRGAEAWLSQVASRFYVCVPFSGEQPTVVYPQNKEFGSDVMLIPFRSHFIHIMGTIISNIVIVANQKELVLANPGWGVTAAAAVRDKAFNCIVTLDVTGMVLVYGYNQDSISKAELTPLLCFKTFSHATYLTLTSSNEKLLIAVMGVVGNVVLYEILMRTIVAELGES